MLRPKCDSNFDVERQILPRVDVFIDLPSEVKNARADRETVRVDFIENSCVESESCRLDVGDRRIDEVDIDAVMDLFVRYVGVSDDERKFTRPERPELVPEIVGAREVTVMDVVDSRTKPPEVPDLLAVANVSGVDVEEMLEESEG